MCFYVCLGRALAGNLLARLWGDFVDYLAMCKRRCSYRCRNIFARYDDVGGPAHTDGQHSESSVDQSELGGNGCFLVRPSSNQTLAITLWYNHRPYNIPIRKREDNKISLGTRKPNERVFDTVEDLINFYKTEELILFSRGEKTGKCALKSTPYKNVSAEDNQKNIKDYISIRIPDDCVIYI